LSYLCFVVLSFKLFLLITFTKLQAPHGSAVLSYLISCIVYRYVDACYLPVELVLVL